MMDLAHELKQAEALLAKVRTASAPSPELRDVAGRAAALVIRLSAYQRTLSASHTADVDVAAQLARIAAKSVPGIPPH